MKTFEFSIIASGLNPSADDFESRFYNAGCDDATISFQKGHIIVDFEREAESIDAAISSAVEAVISAGAKVDRVEPDPLVSLSEIATRIGMTRAAISQYSKGLRCQDFPAPVARVTSESPLWDWYGVAQWLFRNHKVGRDVAITAGAFKQVNEAIGSGESHIGVRLAERVRELEDAF